MKRRATIWEIIAFAGLSAGIGVACVSIVWFIVMLTGFEELDATRFLIAGALQFFLVFPMGLIVALVSAFPLGILISWPIIRLFGPNLAACMVSGVITGAIWVSPFAFETALGTGERVKNGDEMLLLFIVSGAIAGSLAHTTLFRRRERA